MTDGRILTDVDPEYERRYREFMVTNSLAPSHFEDPSYHWRRK